MGDFNKDELLYLSRLAEQCERFDGKFELRLQS